jgi:hydroxymethylglutaryl-CoA lyase/(R)-citramalyl-CoA lyase
VKLTLCDVAPGGGLRQAGDVLEPAMRTELIDRLAAAGLARIEVASFEADGEATAEAESVVASLRRREGVSYAAAMRDSADLPRLGAALDEVRVPVPVSETLADRLGGRSVDGMLSRLGEIAETAHQDDVRVTAEIAGAFGCPFEGEVDGFHVYDIAVRAVGSGADELLLADSAGAATPSEVRRLIPRCQTTRVRIGLRLSDTRSTAIACALAAVDEGVSLLDGSVGGLGAPPSRRGPAAVVATEDLVYALEREGVDTGIDLEGLIAVAEWLAAEVGHALPGRTYRVGTFPPR